MSHSGATNEIRYYLALRKIAKEFMSPEKLRRDSEKLYGLRYEECLEMAYDNIRAMAAAAIHGKRMPKGGAS